MGRAAPTPRAEGTGEAARLQMNSTETPVGVALHWCRAPVGCCALQAARAAPVEARTSLKLSWRRSGWRSVLTYCNPQQVCLMLTVMPFKGSCAPLQCKQQRGGPEASIAQLIAPAPAGSCLG